MQIRHLFRHRQFVGAAVALTLVAGACGSTLTKSASNTTRAKATLPAKATPTTKTVAEATLPAVVASAGPTLAPLPVPAVKVPASAPTSLITTDLKPGSGDPAANGDTVIVHYVGVLTKNGTEFDDSYKRGVAFPVILGQGQVIKGWDQGLVGVTTGMRRQLDIPGALAYGAQGSGAIGPNEALTFLIDVVAVIKAAKPTDEPVISVTPSPAAPATPVVNDLTVGTGATPTVGHGVAYGLVVYRTDTGEKLASSWKESAIATSTYSSSQILPGIYAGLTGMKVGGRREYTASAESVMGKSNATSASLPSTAGLTLVIDLLAVY